MTGITFSDQGGISGLCHFVFTIQDCQQSLKWLHEKRKMIKNVHQKLYAVKCNLMELTTRNTIDPRNQRFVIYAHAPGFLMLLVHMAF